MSPTINPYAPPTFNETVTQRHDSYLWRDGERLVIRCGAELPPCCMVTGGPAPYSHPISQFWQPRWVYLLFLFAVLPYFFASAFMHRRVELNVPFGRTVYRKHQRWVNLGIVLMIVGGLMVIGFIACAVGQLLTQAVAMLLVFGVLLFLVGLQVASRQPMRLNIIKVENDLIFVDDVHPDYLARLPSVLDPLPLESI